MSVCTYTYDQRLSTTSLWVLKCGLKLEVYPTIPEFQNKTYKKGKFKTMLFLDTLLT